MVDTELDIDSVLSHENITRENILAFKEKVYSSIDGFEMLNEKVKTVQQSVDRARDAQKKKENMLVLGVCHWILGNLDEAIETLSDLKARKISSYFLGKCYQELGDYEEAIEYFERSKHSDSDEFGIQMDIAETQRKAGELKNALKLIQGLSKKHNDEAGLHYQWAHCLDDLGEHDDALAHYNRALGINPIHISTLFRLAYNYDLNGNDEKAIEYYKQCIEQAPTYTNAIMNLGVLYEDQEDYKKAISYYEAVLKTNPNQERARLFLKDAKASLNMNYEEGGEKKRDEETEVLNIPISDFELSVRSKNCLERMNIKTLADLTGVTEESLLSYKNFGETSLNEIKHILNQKGLRLGQSLESQEPMDRFIDIGGENERPKPLDLSKPLTELSLSTPCIEALEGFEIVTIGAVVSKKESELLGYEGVEQAYIDEIKLALGKYGLTLEEEN